MAKTKPAVAMKRLVFGKNLMSPSLDGSKSYTVRKYRPEAHDFKKDEIVIGEFMDGLDILIQIKMDTVKGSFKSIRNSSCRLNIKFNQQYFDDLKSYYPDLTWDTMGAVVFFEVLKVDGVPAVQYNKHSKPE